ncbi:MAG: cation diffusion facilitator family transporter [Gemmatimonadales bacterium]|nr:cation diffusion facilitator family transporter [Gemmatimonadales bacterium]
MNRTEKKSEAGQSGQRSTGVDTRPGLWKRPVACTAAGLVGNVLLSGGKLFIGFQAGSAALVADGYHSLADVLSDIGILLALKAASTPPDEDHPYGHHSFETLGAILVAAFMLLTAVLIGKNAIFDLLAREFPKPEIPALWASLGAVFIKEIMARYTLFVGRFHGSPALLANGAMHRSDAISSLAAAAGIGGALLGWTYLDNVGALVISLFILKMGWDLLRENVMALMDTMPDKELVGLIRQSVESVPCVQEVRDLKVRQRGSFFLADVRLSIHPDHTIEAAHNIAHEAENKVRRENQKVATVFIHVEPGSRQGNHSCPSLDLKKSGE